MEHAPSDEAVDNPEDAGNELMIGGHGVPVRVKEDVFRAVRPVDLAAMVGKLTLLALSGMEETLTLGRLFSRTRFFVRKCGKWTAQTCEKLRYLIENTEGARLTLGINPATESALRIRCPGLPDVAYFPPSGLFSSSVAGKNWWR